MIRIYRKRRGVLHDYGQNETKVVINVDVIYKVGEWFMAACVMGAFALWAGGVV